MSETKEMFLFEVHQNEQGYPEYTVLSQVYNKKGELKRETFYVVRPHNPDVRGRCECGWGAMRRKEFTDKPCSHENFINELIEQDIRASIFGDAA